MPLTLIKSPLPPDPPQEVPVLAVVLADRFLYWLLSLLPVWETITREEAAQQVLSRDVQIRYAPVIVEYDQKKDV